MIATIILTIAVVVLACGHIRLGRQLERAQAEAAALAAKVNQEQVRRMQACSKFIIQFEGLGRRVEELEEVR